MHPKSTLKLLSVIMLGLSAVMLIPALVALFCNETECVKAFAVTLAALGIISAASLYYTKDQSLENFSPHDAFFFTTLTWLIAAAFGAIPLVITKALPDYSDAFFEIMSGFTTTGATRLQDVESLPRSILLWRSITNWLGGMGIVVLFLSILPSVGSGAGAFYLMGAETVGPVKSKLTPKTRSTAVVLWLIYTAMTVAQILLLLPSGIGLFDCVNISLSTVSTAGFSIKNSSIGFYNSAYIDAVVTIFMLLAGINFSLYYQFITGRRKQVFHNTELRTYIIIVAAAVGMGTACLRISGFYPTLLSSLRYMAFQVVSIITTTGFTTANYISWHSFALSVLILLMFVGGCAGSTGGGIKVIRLVTSFRAVKNTIRKKIHPNAVYNVIIDEQTVPQAQVSSILCYIFLYIVTWLAGALIISLSGLDIQSCLSSSILTLGNIGAGFGNETFAVLPHWTNWIYSFLMMAGRLELFTILVLFVK